MNIFGWTVPALIVFMTIIVFTGVELSQYQKHECLQHSMSSNYTPDQIVLICKY